MRTRALAITIFLFSFNALQAQSRAELMGDSLYKYQNYSSAMEYYKRALKKNETSEIKLKLAETYHFTGQAAEAVALYSQLENELDQFDAKYTLHYAQDLHVTGKHDRALALIDQMPSVNLDETRPNSFWTIESVNFNSDQADFSPVDRENELIFISSRPEHNASKKNYSFNDQPYLDIYKVISSDSTVEVKPFSTQVNGPFHDGPVTFFPDGKRMILSRTLEPEGKQEKDVNYNRFGLFYSEITDDGNWSAPTPMPFNHPDFSVGYPALDPTGSKLYFASDMPGGQGGFDLYVSELSNGAWQEPVAVSGSVNTAANEVFTSISKDGTLYFSSDKPGGSGGLDIYYSEYSPAGWMQPVAMPHPVNGITDDFGVHIDQDGNGYFSSNRSGNDDIYKMKRHFVSIKFRVVDVQDKSPVKEATILVKDEEGNIIAKLNPDANGLTFMEGMPGEQYDIAVQGDGYEEYTTQVSIPEQAVELEEEILLVKTGTDLIPGDLIAYYNDRHELTGYFSTDSALYEIESSDDKILISSNGTTTVLSTNDDVELSNYFNSDAFKKDLNSNGFSLRSSRIIENIYFDYDLATIRSEAAGELDKLVTILKDNPQLKIAVGAHTDLRGSTSYNMRLSKNRALSTIDYLKTHGIDPDRIVYKNFGKSQPVENCDVALDSCDEKIHQLNRRAEFALYYDHNAYQDYVSLNRKKETVPSSRPSSTSKSPPTYEKLLDKYGDKKADNLVFKVAIGAYKHNHDLTFDELTDLGKIEKVLDGKNMMWYYLAPFTTWSDAETARAEVMRRGISGAYVTYFLNDRKISYREFAKL